MLTHSIRHQRALSLLGCSLLCCTLFLARGSSLSFSEPVTYNAIQRFSSALTGSWPGLKALFSPLSSKKSYNTVQGTCRQWCANPAYKSEQQRGDGCLSKCSAFPVVTTFPSALAKTQSAEDASAPPGPTIYAAFYAEGERGSEGYDTYHMFSPSTSYLTVLRRTDPMAEVWVITDQATQLNMPGGVRIYRHEMDRAKLGRNAWSNYYQYEAQAAFLHYLDNAPGGSPRPNVVFADMDALILKPLHEVFAPLGNGQSMDIAFTVSDTEQMPVNIGLQFVPGNAYRRAANFYEALLRTYVTPGPFVQGQITVAQFLGLYQNRTEVLGRLEEAMTGGRSCRQVPLLGLGAGVVEGQGQGEAASPQGKDESVLTSHSVCLLPCHRYNHCHAGSTSCCTGMGPGRLPFSPQTPSELEEAGVKVLHMVGFRKPGLPYLEAAMERGGLPALYEAFSKLPHGEEEWRGVKL